MTSWSQWGLWRRLACWETLFSVRYCFEFEVGTGQLDVFDSFIFLFCFLFGWPDWTNWLQEVVYLQNWKQWVDQVTAEIEPMRLLMTKPFPRSAKELLSDSHLFLEWYCLLLLVHWTRVWDSLIPAQYTWGRARNLTRFPAYQRAMGQDCTVPSRPLGGDLLHIYSIIIPDSICKETWVVPILFPI
jgi:hypothetical protein